MLYRNWAFSKREKNVRYNTSFRDKNPLFHDALLSRNVAQQWENTLEKSKKYFSIKILSVQ